MLHYGAVNISFQYLEHVQRAMRNSINRVIAFVVAQTHIVKLEEGISGTCVVIKPELPGRVVFKHRWRVKNKRAHRVEFTTC